jgi:hypothetical protein
MSAKFFDDEANGSQAHRREHAEAAIIEASQTLDKLGLQYVIYVRTSPTTFARKIRFGTGKAMVHGLWFVVTDLVDMMREIAYFTGDAVDQNGGLED